MKKKSYEGQRRLKRPITSLKGRLDDEQMPIVGNRGTNFGQKRPARSVHLGQYHGRWCDELSGLKRNIPRWEPVRLNPVQSPMSLANRPPDS